MHPFTMNYIQMPSVSPTGANAQVVYSLPDSAEGHFSIEATTGVIRLEKPLRVGPQAALQLTVRASDLGTPIPLSTLGTVTVSVVGLEDYLPVFLNTEHSVQVPEDALLGMEVLQLATLTRPGSEKTGYRMVSGNEQGRFRLDARTGERAVEAARPGLGEFWTPHMQGISASRSSSWSRLLWPFLSLHLSRYQGPSAPQDQLMWQPPLFPTPPASTLSNPLSSQFLASRFQLRPSHRRLRPPSTLGCT